MTDRSTADRIGSKLLVDLRVLVLSFDALEETRIPDHWLLFVLFLENFLVSEARSHHLV